MAPYCTTYNCATTNARQWVVTSRYLGGSLQMKSTTVYRPVTHESNFSTYGCHWWHASNTLQCNSTPAKNIDLASVRSFFSQGLARFPRDGESHTLHDWLTNTPFTFHHHPPINSLPLNRINLWDQFLLELTSGMHDFEDGSIPAAYHSSSGSQHMIILMHDVLHVMIAPRFSFLPAQYPALSGISIHSLPLIATTDFTMPNATSNPMIPHHGMPASSKTVPSKLSLNITFNFAQAQEEPPPLPSSSSSWRKIHSGRIIFNTWSKTCLRLCPPFNWLCVFIVVANPLLHKSHTIADVRQVPRTCPALLPTWSKQDNQSSSPCATPNNANDTRVTPSWENLLLLWFSSSSECASKPTISFCSTNNEPLSKFRFRTSSPK